MRSMQRQWQKLSFWLFPFPSRHHCYSCSYSLGMSGGKCISNHLQPLVFTHSFGFLCATWMWCCWTWTWCCFLCATWTWTWCCWAWNCCCQQTIPSRYFLANRVAFYNSWNCSDDWIGASATPACTMKRRETIQLPVVEVVGGQIPEHCSSQAHLHHIVSLHSCHGRVIISNPLPSTMSNWSHFPSGISHHDQSVCVHLFTDLVVGKEARLVGKGSFCAWSWSRWSNSNGIRGKGKGASIGGDSQNQFFTRTSLVQPMTHPVYGISLSGSKLMFFLR